MQAKRPNDSSTATTGKTVLNLLSSYQVAKFYSHEWAGEASR